MIYGELRRPYSPDQAVLLMRIGDLFVADWSHNGKVRIWSSRDRSCPTIYAASYDADQLRAPASFEEQHHPQGRWQLKTHDFIEKHTGIYLKQGLYMPPEWRG